MSFQDISKIAGSAMAAQTVRLNTIASNLANADGMVFYPNVNQVAEMTDMMSASRAFETNVEVLGRIKSMQQSLLKLGEV